MGKSTILKKLFISSIEKNINIPIFIELRNLSSDKDIVDEIIEGFTPISGKEIDKDFVKELITRGDFIFFLDGYDEIPFQHKEVVTRKLLDFISKASKNIFYITSRHEESLSCFGQFQRFQIDNLKLDEAKKLLYKYDSITDDKIANNLIEQIDENIKSKTFDELESFLCNPLLVSLLYLTFKFKRDIPSSKMDFYGKVYDALYESHDLTKSHFKRPKYSDLSRSDLQKILMKLGFLCLKENVNSYSKNNLLALIGKAIESSYYMELKADDVFKDITETVPLMICDGLDYKWAHKSFTEYFAALYIDSYENREIILNKINNSSNFSNYLNMLDFYYDINQHIFDKVFIQPILNEYIKAIDDKLSGKKECERLLMYFQIIYNRALYIEDKDDLSMSNIDEHHRKIKEIKEKFPLIRDFHNRQILNATVPQHSHALFIKSNRFELILDLLTVKKILLLNGLRERRTLEILTARR